MLRQFGKLLLISKYHTSTSLRMLKYPALTDFGYKPVPLYERKLDKIKPTSYPINLYCYIAKVNERDYVSIQTNTNNYFKVMKHYITTYPHIQLIYRYQIDYMQQHTTWYDIRKKLIDNGIINSDMYSNFNIIKEDYNNDQLIADIEKYLKN